MFKRLKPLLAGILAAAIVSASSASACSTFPAGNVDPSSPPGSSAPNSDSGGGNGSGGNGPGSNDPGSSPTSGNPGVPQADLAGASTVHGIVRSCDLTGMSVRLDDGTDLYVQLGNSRYSQSIGFAPASGEGVTVNGFPGNQGSYVAITVTVDTTGQVYSFRDASGRPLWAGGSGNGKGNK